MRSLLHKALRIVAEQLEKDYKLIDKIPKDLHEQLARYLRDTTQIKVFGKYTFHGTTTDGSGGTRIYSIFKIKKDKFIRLRIYHSTIYFDCGFNSNGINYMNLYHTGKKVGSLAFFSHCVAEKIRRYTDFNIKFDINNATIIPIDKFSYGATRKYDLRN